MSPADCDKTQLENKEEKQPFIDVAVSKKLTPDNENAIKTALGDAIALFPGKSEAWLMCRITDCEHMWFKGTNDTDSALSS